MVTVFRTREVLMVLDTEEHSSNITHSPSHSARPSVSLRDPSSRRLAFLSIRLTNSALLPLACRRRLFPLPPSTRTFLPLGLRRRLLRLTPSTSSVSSIITVRSTSRRVSTRNGDILFVFVCLFSGKLQVKYFSSFSSFYSFSAHD